MIQEKICAIDATWLMHRAHNTMSAQKVTMIVNWICGYVMQTRSTHLAACFDTGKSFRYGLYKEYKANRHKLADGEDPPTSNANDYYTELRATLEMLRIPVVSKLGLEADDILATIGAQASCSVLVSKDKDQLQGLSKTCSIMQPGVMGNLDVFINLPTFVKSRGITPAQFLDIQTLMGDKTDNIPELLTPAVARKLVLKHGSIKAWMNSGATPPTREFVQRMQLNRKLVKMLTDCVPFDMSKFKIPSGPTAPTKILKYLEMVNSVGKKSLFG